MSFWLIATVIVIAACAVAVWWLVPKLWVRRLRDQLPDAKDRADVEDNFRKTVGQLIGGAAVISGAGLAYLQTQQTLHGQLDQTQQTVTSQLISKAIDSLGDHEDRVKRLAGIYTLERVMDAEQYYQTGLDILCGFVRISTENSTKDQLPTPEVQSALDVIAKPRNIGGQIRLANAHIPHVMLDNAILKGANLSGVDLNNAYLQSANLSEAADLIKADLSSAHMFNVNLTDSHLSGANLSGATLFSAKLINADLTDANLSGADLNGADWRDAKLTGAHLENAKLSDALNLTPDQLGGACGNAATELPPSMEKLKLKPCQ